jgi:inorganic pyrophosphatase
MTYSVYIILAISVASIAWGVANYFFVANIEYERQPIVELLKKETKSDQEANNVGALEEEADRIIGMLGDINKLIVEGAEQFLFAEYIYLTLFCCVFALIIGFTVDLTEINRKKDDHPSNFPYTAISFLVGAITSIAAGYIGMKIAVYTNARATYMCCTGEEFEAAVPKTNFNRKYIDDLHEFFYPDPSDAKKGKDVTVATEWTTGTVKDLKPGFMAAFRGGQVLGFCLVGLALLVLTVLNLIYKATWLDIEINSLNGKTMTETAFKKTSMDLIRRHFEFVAGYGLGGSTVALFGRVGGGIYTKAADVGADLVGKVRADLAEDSPENPGTIADNVGDNVGDIAGMGADLFGSLAESTCAALVVSSTSWELVSTADALYFPLIVTSVGIIASFFSVLCVHLFTITVHTVQTVLKMQLLISTILMTGLLVPFVLLFLPANFQFYNDQGTVLDASKTTTNWMAYGCVMCGLWSGMFIGLITEYYTSNAYSPTLKLYRSCRSGAATNIIRGLSLGYESCIIPIIFITATIAFSFTVAGMYGIGLSALGMLGALPVALTIDGYGPISDNAGGIAEMCECPGSIRDRTDALDAAGNTTAAIGKGFAIGSACLVGLALFGAFVTRIQATTVNILQPIQFSGLLIGAMLPYAFSSMTMVAVGDAAEDMMDTIIADMTRVDKERKENEKNGIQAKVLPDYAKCIKVSTDASLYYMIAPGLMVILVPIVGGILFGSEAVEGILAGSIVSGVQVAISASNTGGAWDNAKKETEKRRGQFYDYCN